MFKKAKKKLKKKKKHESSNKCVCVSTSFLSARREPPPEAVGVPPSVARVVGSVQRRQQRVLSMRTAAHRVGPTEAHHRIRKKKKEERKKRKSRRKKKEKRMWEWAKCKVFRPIIFPSTKTIKLNFFTNWPQFLFLLSIFFLTIMHRKSSSLRRLPERSVADALVQSSHE